MPSVHVVTLVLAVLVLAGSARADEPRREAPNINELAEHHWQQGLAFYEAGDFAHAIIEWEAGRQLSQNTLFGFNLAFAFLKLKRPTDAARAARSHCEQNPDDAETVPCQLVRSASQEPANAAAATAASPPTLADRSPVRPKDRGPRKAGVGLVVVGVALVLGGGAIGAYALALRGQYLDAAAAHRDYRFVGEPLASKYSATAPVGLVLLSLGGASTIGGAALLGRN